MKSVKVTEKSKRAKKEKSERKKDRQTQRKASTSDACQKRLYIQQLVL